MVFFRTARPEEESRDIFFRRPGLFIEDALGLDLGPLIEDELGLARATEVPAPPSLLLCRDLDLDLGLFLLRGMVP